MASEAARKDTGGLHRGCVAEPLHRNEGSDRDPPAPALPAWVVLRVAHDLDDGEDVLPARRVADRQIASLQAGAARRRMRAERRGVHLVGQEPARRPANEEPVLDHARGFLTSRTYAPQIRAYVALGLLLVALAAVSGCGGSDEQATPAGEPATTGSTTTAPPTTVGTDVLEGAGTTAVEAQASGSETALLERIAVGRHEGYDRVVFQFRNDLPGYRIQYVQPPLKEDGSGNPVEVQGGAVVLVRMEPASGFDLGTDEGVMVYKGPKRIAGSSAGTSIVQELARTGDFEAVLSWAIGLEDKFDFRVRAATSPARLIVDFRNH